MDKTIVTKLKEELDSTFELLKRYKDFSDKASDIISRLENELDNSLEALSKYKRIADEQSQKIVSLEKEIKRLKNRAYYDKVSDEDVHIINTSINLSSAPSLKDALNKIKKHNDD